MPKSFSLLFSLTFLSLIFGFLEIPVNKSGNLKQLGFLEITLNGCAISNNECVTSERVSVGK